METTVKYTSKPLNISLWAAQIILAAMFIFAGFPKATQSIQELAIRLPMANEFPLALIRFIGITELLGGIGLLLPGILRIKLILTPYAAIGILLIMLMAVGYHISKGEFAAIGINLGLALLAAFVAWGRLTRAPMDANVVSSLK
ncbi:DoxX family protein [Rhodocytophaga rosea]|uniref:DoxX family protein n=1 Tax=Rhodocytophaga rosea TaxID=2704465 RepID=A0A6C0GQ55_9BACT|nr:DoxX family protein [Rhodocytophaga rosea]QHT69984.1 DoxX family protein [Rhodocytophaga rosea]